MGITIIPGTRKRKRDINPNSATYGQERWVTNGYNPMACALPATAIYARIDYTDWYYDVAQTFVTVWIKFYSDAACTIPTSVSNLAVNYRKDKYPCSGDMTSTNYLAICNGTRFHSVAR